MNISVWYHTRLIGGDPPIDPDFSISLMTEQMGVLKEYGLEDSAHEIVVCVNGGYENQVMARAIAPKKSRFIDHGSGSKSLLPTVNALREWSTAHKDWLVCFFHIKGVTHPWDELNTRWRQCMEKCVIKNWRRCVADIQGGCDTVGAHWLTKEKYGPQVTFPFWGGQFFWAKASFLSELPSVPNSPTCRQDWFISENWIGMGRPPKIKDYAPHWPGISACRATI
jgi:hypothetical protein